MPIHIPSMLPLSTSLVIYAVIAAFALGYALGWLGRPEREEIHYGDDFVSSDTLDHILRLENKKGYRP